MEVAVESSSEKISCRCPVEASIRTIGWFASKTQSMSVSGTAPVFWNACWLSSP
jgi:hypothetical protein